MSETFRVFPLNRVEGDLEIKIAIKDGHITDSWSSGVMFRGFERMLLGRSPLDSLVITPRICGICSMTHLTAAVKALDAMCGVSLPDNAVRARNIALLAEHIQSDVRQSTLMYMVDFTNPAYVSSPLYEEAVRRYAPLAGESCAETIRQTKKLIEIIAILGGQWPHTSFMVPGGVVSTPSLHDILECEHIAKTFREWYERRIIGCSIERWKNIENPAQLEQWLDESDSTRNSEVGFLIRFGREIGLDKIGKGTGAFISYGAFDLPSDTAVKSTGDQRRLIPSGVFGNDGASPLDTSRIAESVEYSWYEDSNSNVAPHPFAGVTEPHASGNEGKKYSWAKAPRYNGIAAETGPLAERVIAGDPLFRAMIADSGANALTRQLARLTRPVLLLDALQTWIGELMANSGAPFYRKVAEIHEGQGEGLIEAARGALGHWVKINNGVISSYQIITPTGWNGSPRAGNGARGPWEEALVGTPLKDENNPVEAGHVVRSFDPCLVCAVHTVGKNRRTFRV